ncbi:MAG: hypothetical protein ACM3NO_06830 [Deltaproteobacteria bacterium]
MVRKMAETNWQRTLFYNVGFVRQHVRVRAPCSEPRTAPRRAARVTSGI